MNRFMCTISGHQALYVLSVAIKLECIKTKHPQLHIESKFYRIMQGWKLLSRSQKLGQRANLASDWLPKIKEPIRRQVSSMAQL